MTAAWWSAIAASFSALAAVVVMRIQVRNYQESVRPELVLTGFAVSEEGHSEGFATLIVQGVRNVGRGPAFHVMALPSPEKARKRLDAIIGATDPVAVLAPNESTDQMWRFSTSWKPSVRVSGYQSVPARIELVSWDRADVRHRTTYELILERRSHSDSHASRSSFTMKMHHRKTLSESTRWVKFTRRPAWFNRLASVLPNKLRSH